MYPYTFKVILVVVIHVLLEVRAVPVGSNSNETEALIFLKKFDKTAEERSTLYNGRKWNDYTGVESDNQYRLSAKIQELYQLQASMRTEAFTFNWTSFTPSTRRQFEINFADIGTDALEDLQAYEYLLVKASMHERYAEASVRVGDESLPYDPDLANIMANSRDYNQLYRVWKGWRESAGDPSSRDDFKKYVEMKNIIARANGHEDAGQSWRSEYEIDNLEEEIEKMYLQLSAFYGNLHAYVRRKLYDVYGPNYINLKGPIPAHVLGNMWAQQWGNLREITKPFPGKAKLDVSPALRQKNFTALQMVHLADDFITSLGMIEMPQNFWDNSVFEKPKDGRRVSCHGSAWDFLNRVDFRMLVCADITMDDFILVHHEMGHVEYFLQYKDQPYAFRRGANPGFHEAVGDVFTLSVITPKHLYSVGLLESLEEDYEADINYLMSVALNKIAFLPFGYLVDKWRWRVFDGSIPPEEYNTRWWDLRRHYQGIVPPTKRTEEHFDPAAKYHVSEDIPYIRYFISFVIQFQFHKALCNESGHVGPLHKCDIYGSKKAGKLFGDMLQMGASEHWSVAMKAITGQTAMDANALLEYFQPLLDWLEKQNENETLGWDHDIHWFPKEPELVYGAATLHRGDYAIIYASLTSFFFYILDW